MKKKEENQDKFKKIVSTIILIIWCLLIFYFSSQSGDTSSISSSRVIDFLNKLFSINLYNFKYSVFIIRKLAHMFLYFILYLLATICFKSYKIEKYYLYAFFFCLIYASGDEMHQLFTFERSASIIDILVDLVGSTVSYVILKLIDK